MTCFYASRGSRLLFPLALFGLLLSCVCGCGGDNPFKMAPVSGKVTYDDGSVIPATRLRVVFHPQCEAVDRKHPHLANGEVNVSDGTFLSVGSWAPSDGAVLGRHKVTVISYDDSGDVSDAVPADYRKHDTTPAEDVEVKSGKNHFEIKVSKPSLRGERAS